MAKVPFASDRVFMMQSLEAKEKWYSVQRWRFTDLTRGNLGLYSWF